MKKPVCNGLQAESIRRYHRHLQRLGRAGTLDESACKWIRLYAHTWRAHHQEKRTTAGINKSAVSCELKI